MTQLKIISFAEADPVGTANLSPNNTPLPSLASSPQLPTLPQTYFMSDDKKNTGKQDDIRVDINDPSEVEYVHRKFPNKTHEEVKEAIRKYGPMRKDIEAALRK